MQLLESDNIRLRAPEPEDLDVLYEWENNTEIWYLSNTLTPFSRYSLKKFIENSHLDIYESKQTRFIIELKSEQRPIGAIDLYDFDPYHLRAGVGVLISAKEDRGKGYAGESLQILNNYCFTTLGLKQLYCSINEKNQESIKLIIRKGFVITGQKKDWIKSGEEWMTEYFLQLIR